MFSENRQYTKVSQNITLYAFINYAGDMHCHKLDVWKFGIPENKTLINHEMHGVQTFYNSFCIYFVFTAHANDRPYVQKLAIT